MWGSSDTGKGRVMRRISGIACRRKAGSADAGLDWQKRGEAGVLVLINPGSPSSNSRRFKRVHPSKLLRLCEAGGSSSRCDDLPHVSGGGRKSRTPEGAFGAWFSIMNSSEMSISRSPARREPLPPLQYARKQAEVAAQNRLKVIGGKILLPDLRIEYDTQEGDRAHVDLELATHHYRGSQMRAKAEAGFKMYAPAESAGHLTSAFDPELTAHIFSL